MTQEKPKNGRENRDFENRVNECIETLGLGVFGNRLILEHTERFIRAHKCIKYIREEINLDKEFLKQTEGHLKKMIDEYS